MAGTARPELIATPEWMAENLGRPDLRVIDARWRPDGTARQLHATGHVPNAVYMDWRADVIDTPEGGDALLLAAPDRFGAVMTARGHRRRDLAGPVRRHRVLLRGPDLVEPSGLWLRVGADPGRRLADLGRGGSPDRERRGRGDARPVHARAQVRERLTTADVRGLLGAPDVLLVDARGPAEFRGFEGNVRRLGHIPGAVNVPVATMHQPGTQRLRDAAELRSILLKANITRGRRLVCYDGSGVAAAKLAYVLMVLGHEDVAVYDGGWAEWGDRLDLPVDR